MSMFRLKAIENQIDQAEPLYWGSQAQSEIDGMLSDAARHERGHLRFLMAAAIVGGAAAAVAMLTSENGQDVWTARGLLLLPVLSAFVALVSAGVAEALLNCPHPWTGDRQRVRKALRPLARTPSLCSEALEIVRSDSNADAYRRRVLTAGRELLAIDLRVMQDLQERHSLEAQHRLHCQALHDLAHTQQQTAAS